MQTQTQRGSYGEIPIYTLDAETRKRISALVEGAASAAKVDEHGTWEFGVTRLNRRGTRWAALNWDLYAHGHDAHSGRLLVVVQIRQAVSDALFAVGLTGYERRPPHHLSGGTAHRKPAVVNLRLHILDNHTFKKGTHPLLLAARTKCTLSLDGNTTRSCVNRRIIISTHERRQ